MESTADAGALTEEPVVVRAAERLAWLAKKSFSPADARRVASRVARTLSVSPDSGSMPGHYSARVLTGLGYRVRAVSGSRTELSSIVSKTRPILRLMPGGRFELLIKAEARRVWLINDNAPQGTWKRLSEDDDSQAAAYLIDLERYQAPPQGSAVRRMFSILRFESPDVAVVALYAFASGIFSMSTPLGVQALVSTLRLGAVIQPLVVLVLVVVGALSLLAILRVLEVKVIEVLQRRLLVRLATDMVARIPWSEEEVRRQGGASLLNRFFDIFIVHKSLAFLLLDGLDLILATTLGLILLGFYHPILLAFDLVLVAGFVSVWLLGRGGVSSSVYESKQKHKLAAWLDRVADAPRLFRSTVGYKMARDHTDTLTRDYLKARDDHFQIVLRQTRVALWIQALASGALLGIGGWLVMQGQLTLGQLVAAEIIVTLVVSSFAKIGKHIDSFYDLSAAADKVAMLLDISPDGGGPSEMYIPEDRTGGTRVELDGVVLGRGRLGKIPYHSFESNSFWGLWAPSGAGKSTLADALVHPDRLADGEIRLDGLPSQSMDAAERYDRVEIVNRPPRWCGSLLDHLQVSSNAIEASEASELLRSMGLGPTLNHLPKGIDTELQVDGAPLSESECVRLELARALLRSPGLLVIDGLLDGLDSQEITDLIARLQSRLTSTTVWILTRRRSVAGQCPQHLALGDADKELQ